MRIFKSLLLTTALLYFTPVHASVCSCLHHLFIAGAHEIGIGPEWYYIDRRRCSGSELYGNLYGGILNYDRFRRNSLYWGFAGEYALGRLHGHQGDLSPLRATGRDWRVEGRLGWTFDICAWANPFLTLYVGYGHFEEQLNFKEDCDIVYSSKIPFDYFPFGIYFRCNLTCAFWIGIRAQGMWPTDPKNVISNDSGTADATLQINKRVQWLVELPIEWRCRYGFRVTPFYWRRDYGQREGFPADFSGTRSNIGGVRLEVTTAF